MSLFILYLHQRIDKDILVQNKHKCLLPVLIGFPGPESKYLFCHVGQSEAEACYITVSEWTMTCEVGGGSLWLYACFLVGDL